MFFKITEIYKENDLLIKVEEAKTKGEEQEDIKNSTYIEYRDGVEDLQNYFEDLEIDSSTVVKLDSDLENMMLYDEFILNVF